MQNLVPRHDMTRHEERAIGITPAATRRVDFQVPSSAGCVPLSAAATATATVTATATATYPALSPPLLATNR